ncbi:glycosyltransferase family 4 protein [Pantoea sp. B65]
MKILHFYKSYYPDSFGGIEQFIFQLSEAGISRGIVSTILSLSSRTDIDQRLIGSNNVHYATTNFEIASTPFSFAAIAQFKQLAAEADIIHYHFPYPFMDMVHFITHVNKTCVVSYHSDIVKQKLALKIYTPLMNRFLRSVDCIVAASPNYVTTSPTLQKFLPKVMVIPYGLNKNLYPEADEKHLHRWRQRLGERFFLFIGTFRYYKGLHILLDALKETGFPMVIVGAGPIEAKLKKQARRLGLENIYFLGALPDEDKVALLRLCYSVVFPSHLRSEAFGITLLEGAMFGKPMISSEIGTGTTYINIDKQTGLVVPPSDAAALRAAMVALWNNPLLAGYYGENAAKRFQALFTSERMAESYIALYQHLMKRHT